MPSALSINHCKRLFYEDTRYKCFSKSKISSEHTSLLCQSFSICIFFKRSSIILRRKVLPRAIFGGAKLSHLAKVPYLRINMRCYTDLIDNSRFEGIRNDVQDHGCLDKVQGEVNVELDEPGIPT